MPEMKTLTINDVTYEVVDQTARDNANSNGVFIATYGTTTHAEIKAAYDAGKVCFCKTVDGANIYTLVTCTEMWVVFSRISQFTNENMIVMMNDVWDNSSQASLLPTTGGHMTGALTLSGDPTKALHAATKQYVDNAIAAAIAAAMN